MAEMLTQNGFAYYKSERSAEDLIYEAKRKLELLPWSEDNAEALDMLGAALKAIERARQIPSAYVVNPQPDEDGYITLEFNHMGTGVPNHGNVEVLGFEMYPTCTHEDFCWIGFVRYCNGCGAAFPATSECATETCGSGCVGHDSPTPPPLPDERLVRL